MAGLGKDRKEDAMEKLKVFVSEHRAAALMALFALLVFIGGSALSAVNVAQMRAQESVAPEQGQADAKDPDAPAQEDEQQEDLSLTDSQQEAIEAYDEDTKDFIDSLSSSVWSANGGRYTLRFSDDQYTETVDGESTQHSYAILRLEGGMDDAGNDVSTAVVETDTGTHMLTYANMTASKGSKQATSTLSSSSMFALKDASYTRADAVENIAVTGLNSAVTDLIGGSPDTLTTELSRWCAVHYPTATEAAWNQVASIDWENGVITTGFTLNGESTVSLTVVYLMDSGTFDFSY